MLGGREINRWTFEEISLAERDAREGLSGAPGLAALVPLMRGGSERRVAEQAARRIERAFPGERLSEAEDVLLALASRYYTDAELARIVGRDRMIESSLYVAGRAQGRLESAKRMCAAVVRKQHPTIARRALPAITACSEPTRLHQWTLAALELDDMRLLQLLESTSSPKAPVQRRSRRRR